MIGAAVKKDLQLLLRDRGAVVTMFLLPVVFMAVFGSIFGCISPFSKECFKYVAKSFLARSA